MRFSLQILLFVLCAVYVTGKSCIKGKGRLKCTKGSDDCKTAETGLVCMTFSRSKGRQSSHNCLNGGCEKSSRKMNKAHISYCGGPQAHGCFCDSELPEAEACQEGLSCQNNSGGRYKCLPEVSFVPMDIPCDDPNIHWQMVYEHDRVGEAVSGQLHDLYDAVRNGAEVKVWSEFFGLTNVQKISFHEENETGLEIHAQGLFGIGPNRRLPYDVFLILSTNGNLHYTFLDVGDSVHDVRLNTNYATGLQWYVRDVWRYQDDMVQLRSQIENGASVKAMANQAIRHIEQVDIAGDFLQGWSIWEMRDTLHGQEFNYTDQWLHIHWTESGNMDVASWVVNTHTTEYSESLQNQAIEWFVGTCWSQIYSHGPNGTALSGSKLDLIDAIHAGKRVKIRIGTRFHEANALNMIDGEIKMQVYDSINDNVTEGEWNWLHVSTTGEVTTYTNAFGSPNVSASTTNEAVAWFVENRNWTTVTDVTGLGGVSKIAVDARFSVTTDTDVTWYQADLIHPESGAHHEREIVYVADANEYRQRYLVTFLSPPQSIFCSDRSLGQKLPHACNITFQSFQWYIAY